MPKYTSIPSPGVWELDTPGHFGKGRKASELIALDNAIKNYDELRKREYDGGMVSTAMWSEALITLFAAVEVYLASKNGKHAKERTAAATALREVVLKKLSQIRWKKISEAATTGKEGSNLKAMVPHVWSEMHSPGHARVGHGEDPTYAPDFWEKGEESNFGTGNEKYLFEHLRQARDELGQKIDGVRYIENEDRWKYLVAFDGTGMANQRGVSKGYVQKGADAPITTQGGDLGTYIYAMDGDGNVYTENAGIGGQQLNHCSFLAGKPVLCAGNIGITQGRVGYIDNGSGHYRPSRKNLVKCLEKLAELCDIDGLYVRDHAGPYKMAIYFGGQFLARHGFLTPNGYYTSVKGRYDENVKLFWSEPESLAYVMQQEQELDNEKLKKEMATIMAELDVQKDKARNNPSVKRQCKDAAQRQKIQTALLQRLTPKNAILPLVTDDAEMQQFFVQHPEIPMSV